MNQAIVNMLEMQESMNSRVHENWRDQNFEWFRAVWVECAELMDHYGYKWWKHQESDLAQVQLELVDIWHFGMSAMLQNEKDHNVLADKISSSWKMEAEKDLNFRESIEGLVSEVIHCRSFSIPIFSQLISFSGLSFNELYVSYVGKNVLNFFRQDKGYKEGTYQKYWNGREDNEFLNDLLSSMDSSGTNFSEHLYKALEEEYKRHNDSYNK